MEKPAALNRSRVALRCDLSSSTIATSGLAAIPASRDQEPDARASGHEVAGRLQAACAALPALQREAFLLHQEGGLELAEIAELTGAGVETVKSRIRYAVAKLRLELGDLQ